jgi:hypothetical protein
MHIEVRFIEVGEFLLAVAMRLSFASVELWPLTCPYVKEKGVRGRMILLVGNQGTRSKSYPSGILCTANPTCTVLTASLALRGKNPETNGLSHGWAETGDVADKYRIVALARSRELLHNKTDKGLGSNFTHLITYL